LSSFSLRLGHDGRPQSTAPLQWPSTISFYSYAQAIARTIGAADQLRIRATPPSHGELKSRGIPISYMLRRKRGSNQLAYTVIWHGRQGIVEKTPFDT